MSELVVLLHGFGGTPRDCESLRKKVSEHWPERDIVVPDIHKEMTSFSSLSLSNWAEEFSAELEKRAPQRLVVLGYSLGGRLALSLLKTSLSPKIRAMICLSTRPGIWQKNEMIKRKEFDRAWAQRFRELEYDQVNFEWQKLAVFQGSSSSSLRTDIPLQDLAACFENWSPTQHPFSVQDLQLQASRLFWIYGERDSSYELVKEFVLNQKLGQLAVLPGAGHRVLLDNEQALFQQLDKIFLTGEL